MKNNTKVLRNINNCLLPKLSKNFEESTNHIEFDVRNENLEQNFEQLKQSLIDLTLENNAEASTIISFLYILYQELKCDSPWNDEKANEYSKKLNFYFEVMCNVSLENVLIQESAFSVQEIFDKCLEVLHCKLTSEDIKKYPGLIEVFYNLLSDVTTYNVKVKPQKTFPVLLRLIDDYIPANKNKGLHCCEQALQCMGEQDFKAGNYHEVLYRSLKRNSVEKDCKITVLTHKCLQELCRLFPPKVMGEKLNDMYSGILYQLSTESNIYRKAECLKFTKFIVARHGINCLSKGTLLRILYVCLDMCINVQVANIMLKDTLMCLNEWITRCWCVWQLSTDYKIISVLLKVLYTCKERSIYAHIQRSIIVLIRLNNENERKQLLASLDKAVTVNDNDFKSRIFEIKFLYSKIDNKQKT